MEEWKPVVIEKNGTVYDYSGLYEVSNVNGKVRNIQTGKLLKPEKNENGYCVLTLSKDGEQHKFKVHRLVATAFIPNPYNKPEVDHINHDRTDNSVENLRWATRTEQFNNLWRKRLNVRKIMLKDVEKCRVIVFRSCNACARYLGTDRSTVKQAARKGYKCRGYEVYFMGN